MHPADINAALKKAGYTQRRIAKDLGVRQPTVYLVVYGKGTSARIAKAIAQATGLPLSTLWPGKYDKPAAGRVPDRRDHDRRAAA